MHFKILRVDRSSTIANLPGVLFLGLWFLTFLASEGPHKQYSKNRTPKTP